MRFVACLSATALAVLSVQAQQSTSLFLPPNFEGLPLSVDVGGVDGQGRTTYIVQAGGPGPADGVFPGTATLVQGSAGASFTYHVDTPEAQITLGWDCTFQGTGAVCVGKDSGGNPDTETLSSIPFIEVQLGTTIAPDAPAPSGGSASVHPPPGVSQSGSGAGSGSLPGPPQDGEDDDDSAASARLWPSIGMLAGIVASISFLA